MNLEILKYPDERLKLRSQKLVEFDSYLESLVENLVKLMKNQPRCVGIAAPQVNIHKRIIAVDTSLADHKE